MRHLLVILILVTATACSKKEKEEFVKLRIKNETAFDFSNVSSNGFNFGNVKSKSKSHYLKLQEIKNYPDIKFHLGNQPFESKKSNYNYFQQQTFQTDGKYSVNVQEIIPERGMFYAVLQNEEKL